MEGLHQGGRCGCRDRHRLAGRPSCEPTPATHLLQKALKSVLGNHVHQAGSLVEPDRLRFDFTHYAALTPEELARVDSIVQNAILGGLPHRDPADAH